MSLLDLYEGEKKVLVVRKREERGMEDFWEASPTTGLLLRGGRERR